MIKEQVQINNLFFSLPSSCSCSWRVRRGPHIKSEDGTIIPEHFHPIDRKLWKDLLRCGKNPHQMIKMNIPNTLTIYPVKPQLARKNLFCMCLVLINPTLTTRQYNWPAPPACPPGQGWWTCPPSPRWSPPHTPRTCSRLLIFRSSNYSFPKQIVI